MITLSAIEIQHLASLKIQNKTITKITKVGLINSEIELHATTHRYPPTLHTKICRK